MKTTLHRRLQDLEARNDAAGDALPVDWGPGFEHLPSMTQGGLRRMLQEIHDSGAGRLPIVNRDVVMGRKAQGDRHDQTPTSSCAGTAIEP